MGAGNPQGFQPQQPMGSSATSLPMQTRMNMLSGYQPVDRSGWQAYTPQPIAAPTPNSMMQATAPQIPQQVPPQAAAAPIAQDPARNQWQHRGGLIDGSMPQGRGMSDATQAFMGLDPGFGGGVDPTTGQYVPMSALGWDQHMLGQYQNRNQPGSFFYGGNPQAGAHWANTIRRREMTDPLRTAMYGTAPSVAPQWPGGWPSLRI